MNLEDVKYQTKIYFEIYVLNLSNFQIPSLFTFENGKIGVNFLGFKASAGLGGLLSGNRGLGGLHAEAETPFGQAAKAGLGGNIDGKGKIAEFSNQVILNIHFTLIDMLNFKITQTIFDYL